MMPSGWSLLKVADFLERISIPVIPKEGENYREIGIRSHGKGIFHKEPTDAVKIGSKRVFEIVNNAFIVNIVFAWEQAVAKTTNNEKGFIASHRFPQFLPKNNLCDIDFLLYLFKTPKGKYLLGLASPGGAGRNKTLGQKEFEKLELILPPIMEQTKIAKILSTWDKAISTTEALIDNRKQQKKALMQQLLTGKKRFPGFEGDFERHSFKDLVQIDESSLSSKTPKDYKFKYISLSDVETGKISKTLEAHMFESAPSRAKRIVKKGDILLATVRPNLQAFARVLEENSGHIASTGFSVLSPKKKSCGDYIYHYLFSYHLTGQINSLVVGSNYPAINSSDVGGLKIFCPPYEEQVKIANTLNNCDQTLSVLKNKLEHLKQEKKALMQQLLTGKRRVRIEENNMNLEAS